MVAISIADLSPRDFVNIQWGLREISSCRSALCFLSHAHWLFCFVCCLDVLKCELASNLLAWIYLTFGLRWGSVAWVCVAHDLKKASVVIESTLLLCMIPLNCKCCTVCIDHNCVAVYVLLSNFVWSNPLFLDLNRRDILRESSRFPLASFIFSVAHCKCLWFIFYQVSFQGIHSKIIWALIVSVRCIGCRVICAISIFIVNLDASLLSTLLRRMSP